MIKNLITLVWKLKNSKTGGFAAATLIVAFLNENVDFVSQYLSDAGFSTVLAFMGLVTAGLRMVTTKSLLDK